MRKQILPRTPPEVAVPGDGWVDLERIARVEMTSEDPGHPIEAAVGAEEGEGWRASQPGRQTIRFLFDQPQRIRRVWIQFEEESTPRTQEFVVRWSNDGVSYLDLVRQQWNFVPGSAEVEREDYRFELDGVLGLELDIVPDIARGEAVASVARLRLA